MTNCGWLLGTTVVMNNHLFITLKQRYLVLYVTCLCQVYFVLKS